MKKSVTPNKHAAALAAAATTITVSAAALVYLRNSRSDAQEPDYISSQTAPSTRLNTTTELRFEAQSAANSHAQAHRRFVSGLRLTLASGIVLSTALIALLDYPMDSAEETPWWSAKLSRAAGWIEPADALDIVLYLLTIIATINIAVSLAAPMDADSSDRIATSFWSRCITRFAFFCAVLSITLCVFSWATVAQGISDNSGWTRVAFGLAVAVTLLTFGCILLAAAIRMKSESDIEQRLEFSRIDRKIAQIDARTEKLKIAAGSKVPERTSRGAFRTYLKPTAIILTTSTVLGLVAILTGFKITDLTQNWLETLNLTGVLVICSAVTTTFVWRSSYKRWSNQDRTGWWALSIRPWIDWLLIPGPCAVLVFAVKTTWDNDEVIRFAALLIGLLLASAVPAIYLHCASPQRRTAKGPCPSTPVWREVARSLLDRRVKLEKRMADLERNLEPSVSQTEHS